MLRKHVAIIFKETDVDLFGSFSMMLHLRLLAVSVINTCFDRKLWENRDLNPKQKNCDSHSFQNHAALEHSPPTRCASTVNVLKK